MTDSQLPSSKQVWSHSTNSTLKLTKALENSNITAIEADLVMGRDGSVHGSVHGREMVVPIMSHPPHFESDLSVETFLDRVSAGLLGQRRLRKHIKLDFKDMDTVEPTLKKIAEMKLAPSEHTIFLNADILPGPGRSASDIVMPADQFIEACMRLILNKSSGICSDRIAFSFGFKVDTYHPYGHTTDHLNEMVNVVTTNDLMSLCAGVVLAINARLLVKNMTPFNGFLEQFPHSQILVWTGSTELPISQRKINLIQKHFCLHGTADRVGFDCCVASSSLVGFSCDVLVDLIGVIKYALSVVARLVAFPATGSEKQD